MSGFDPTARIALGRTGLQVTRVALGTAPLATGFWGNDEPTAVATVERAVALGVRFFDTAPLYGSGEAEQRLGLGLHDTPRSQVVVNTKVGRPVVTGADGAPESVFDYSADGVRRSLESSLDRLGLDRVDLVHVHDPEDHLDQAIDEAVPVLCELRAQGVIAAVSVGTNVVSTGERFLADADVDAMLVAGRLTLLDDSASSLVDACRRRDVAYLAAGVFNSGVLARPEPGAWYDYSPADEAVQQRVAHLAQVCAGHGVDLRSAALAFPFRFDGVTSVVIGMSQPAEVDQNLNALRRAYPDALWLDLSAQR